MYAIYYRQENSDGDFTVVKTGNTEVVLDGLDPNTNYDLALVSANALGHSPFLEMKIVNTLGKTLYFYVHLLIYLSFHEFRIDEFPLLKFMVVELGNIIAYFSWMISDD